MPAKKKALRAAAQACGSTTPEPFASFDPATSSWKTWQPSLLEDSTSYSGIWPKSGTMRNGVCTAQPTWAPPKSGHVSGLWLTPQANEDAAGSIRGKMQKMLTQQVKLQHPEEAANGGQLNPLWVAWLMGYPTDWLNSVASAMPSSRNVCSQPTTESLTLRLDR